MSGTRKTWIWHVITLALGIAILGAWIWYTGPKRILDIIGALNIIWMFSAVGIYSLTWIFRTLRYKVFVNEFGLSYTYKTLFQVQISGFALNVILPAKLGDVATVAMLKSKGASLGQSAAIVIQARFLDLVTLLLFVLPVVFKPVGKSILIDLKNSIVTVSATVLIMLLFFLLDIQGVVLAFVKKNIIKDMQSRWGKLITKAENLLGAIKKLFRHPVLFIVALTYSGMIWFLESLSGFFILHAIGWEASLGLVILVVALSNLGKTIPLTPGGIGLYESVWAGLFIAFGVPIEIALLSGMLDQFIKKAFNLLIGLPLAVKWSAGLNASHRSI